MFALRLAELNRLQTHIHFGRNEKSMGHHATVVPMGLAVCRVTNKILSPQLPRKKTPLSIYCQSFRNKPCRLTRDVRSISNLIARDFIRLSRIATSCMVFQMNNNPIKWVKLDKFCEQTGFTRKSVYALIRSGRWMISKHFTKRGRRYFINVVEYERWVERG